MIILTLAICFFLLVIVSISITEWYKRDRDRWRHRAEAESAHISELEQAIETRCEHFKAESGWCDDIDTICEACACFVQASGYKEKVK